MVEYDCTTLTLVVVCPHAVRRTVGRSTSFAGSLETVCWSLEVVLGAPSSY